MSKNLFFFTWDEKYLLKKKLEERKNSFFEKYGKENFFQFNTNDLNIVELKNTVLSWWLFSTKKLIFVFGIPKDSTDKIAESKISPISEFLEENIENISQDNVIIFISYSPDKRTKLYKLLSKKTELKKFNKLKWIELNNFVKENLWDYINNTNTTLFVQKVWDNLNDLYNEIEKIKSYCEYNNCKADEKIIEKVVFSHKESDPFKILDELLRNPEKAIKLIEDEQNKWADTFQFLWMLYWGLRNLIQIIDLYKSWVTSSSEMASMTWIHPFVISKNKKNIENLKLNEQNIINIFEELVEMDNWIKTWKIPAEIFWLEIKNIILKNTKK